MPMSDPEAWRQVASLLATPLVTIDVGARAGIGDPLVALAPNTRIYGFEPNAEECARLNESAAPTVEYIPIALWSMTGQQTFHIAEDPMCSSIYPPVEALAAERPRLELMRTRERTTIEVRTIDDWAQERGVDRLDYAKLDAQGAELAILQGAERMLTGVRAVKIEVQFNPLYEGVPIFGEVDRHLRVQGFQLWRLSELSHCGFAGAGNPQIPEHLDYNDQRVHLIGGGGQLLWGDAYFVREETCRLSSEIGWEDSIRDACLAWIHGYMDLAQASLRRSLAISSAANRDILSAALGVCHPGETS
jgi:FkbM family methyltransferase